MLTAERLKELLQYNPDTGEFHRLKAVGKRWRVGDIAGSTDGDGYAQIAVDGQLYRAHRLAVLYMTGSWPEDVVDHLNGKRADNRWSNLRCCSAAENQRCPRQRANTLSGATGVTLSRSGKRWYAQIIRDGVHHWLGSFSNRAEAIAARKAAEDLLK